MSDNATLMSELRTGLMAVAAFCRGTVDMEPRMNAALDALDRVEALIARIAELEAEVAMLRRDSEYKEREADAHYERLRKKYAETVDRMVALEAEVARLTADLKLITE